MRYKMIVSYDGSFFHGFQRQTKETSVQETIERALSEITKEKITIHGAGRTDADVHAIGQVIHFDSSRIIPVDNLRGILNKKVSPHIYIKEIVNVDDNFHARYSAIKKEYRYYICLDEYSPFRANYLYYYNGKLDIDAINEAIRYLLGRHDFRSFTKNKALTNTVRTIEVFELKVIEGMLEFRIIGDGFLHNMIRVIIALLIRVGNHLMKPSDIEQVINAKNRRVAPYLAPAHGLYLWHVYYL